MCCRADWLFGSTARSSSRARRLSPRPRGVPHAARRVTDEPVRTLTLVSPSGLQRFFESVVREGEEELLAHPERLATLAAEFGSQILGDYPNL
jgi:hypothetical protein